MLPWQVVHLPGFLLATHVLVLQISITILIGGDWKGKYKWSPITVSSSSETFKSQSLCQHSFLPCYNTEIKRPLRWICFHCAGYAFTTSALRTT